MRIIVREGADAGRVIEVDRELTVGRIEGNDVVVVDPRVSSRHATLKPSENGIELTDNGSTNGTFVNGQRLSGSVLLTGGEEVRIGSTVMVAEGEGRLRIPSPAPRRRSARRWATSRRRRSARRRRRRRSRRRAPPPAGRPAAAPCRGDGRRRPPRRRRPRLRCPAARVAAVRAHRPRHRARGAARRGRRGAHRPRPGRAADAAGPAGLDPARDRAPAGDKITVEDLGSANGTLINGAAVDPGERREVQPGGEIQVGETVVVASSGIPAPRASAPRPRSWGRCRATSARPAASRSAT